MNLDAWLTRPEAALAVHVRLHVISMWASRGWLDGQQQRRKLTTRIDPADGKTRQYRYGDVLEAERDTNRSARSHRRRPPVLSIV